MVAAVVLKNYVVHLRYIRYFKVLEGLKNDDGNTYHEISVVLDDSQRFSVYYSDEETTMFRENVCNLTVSLRGFCLTKGA